MVIYLHIAASDPLEFSTCQRMEVAFKQLLGKFLTEFQKHQPYGPSLKEVILWCINYCKFNYHGECDFNVTSMESLFQKLANLECCNFLNLGLLKCLAEASQNACLQASLENYDATFCDAKIVEQMPEMVSYKVLKGASLQKKYKNGLVKLIKEGMTYGELKEFTVGLCNRVLYVQVNTIIRKSYKRGCICICWLVPSCLADVAYSSAVINTGRFVKLGIRYIMIGEHMVKTPEKRKIGPQAPPLTTTVCKILHRYPEGGQILKVLIFIFKYMCMRCIKACN